MDSPIQQTFIPHEAVTSVPTRRGGGGLAELIMLVSIVLFIISAALGAGVFLYTQYLQTSNQNNLSQLQSAQQAFDPTLVKQLTRLDSRMGSAQSLLDAHFAPTQLFTALQQSTVQDIQFTSFTYNASNPQEVTLAMAGTAGSVNSVALQAQVFSQSGVIADPIFSNIDAQPDGVHFNFSALVNQSELKYETFVSGANSQTSQTGAQTQTQTQTQAPAQPPSAASLFQSTSTAPASPTH